jgi:hypothetical protein
MARKYEVFGMDDWSSITKGKGRVVCYCSSLRRFAELLSDSYAYVRKYACKTGNDYEIKRAMAHPDEPVYITREEEIAHSKY